MAQDRFNNDVHVAGALSCQTLAIPENTVDNEDVAAAAGIDASKLDHQYVLHYSQDSTTKSATAKYTVHCVRGATGTIEEFEAGSCTICGLDGTITIDLLKNDSTTSLLTSIITLDSANTAYVPESGTIASTTAAALTHTDVLSVVITSADGTGGTAGSGVFTSLVVREDAD